MSSAGLPPSDRRGGGWPSLEDVLGSTYALPRRMNWRLRALMAMALLGCVLVFGLARWLSTQPVLPLDLIATADGKLIVSGPAPAALHGAEGHTVLDLHAAPASKDSNHQLHQAPMSTAVLPHSTRWISDPVARTLGQAQWHGLWALQENAAAAGHALQLRLEGQPDLPIDILPMGWSRLGPVFWVLCALALMLMGVGSAVLLAAPQWRTASFAMLAMSQSAQLLLLATGLSLGVFRPDWFVNFEFKAHVALDLVCAATVLKLAALHPRRVSGWAGWSVLGWAAALALWQLHGHLASTASWWWIQLGWMAMLAGATLLLSASHRAKPHPLGLLLRRFALVTLLTWSLLSLAVWLGLPRPDMQLNLATYGVITWHVFAALEVMLAPYLSRSRQILQEFSLLAAGSTVAGSLDLLFVAVFSLGPFASMTLSLFLAFGVYLLVRRWLMTHLPGRDAISMERLFQRMYRIAREVARRPDTLRNSLVDLMREVFDPLQVNLVEGQAKYSTTRGNGSVLLVPLPVLQPAPRQEILVLKHSHKGQRLFTSDDARLAQRIVEQLHRAMSFDKAVEQGRSEERLRIAQDLHDDIGARLLTLMYQAPNADIEEYIRHTIQDLKTLTRGLAAQSHGLAEAASEWKRDISQRLGVAHCDLVWHMDADTDLLLTMVQWSSLTRIVRELVSNTISHAKANEVEIRLSLLQDQLTLSVSDNGSGRNPAAWSHGLGLGGVRKRVKQLGGSVRWVEVEPKGIRCEVVVSSFSGSASTHQTSGAHAGADSQFSH